MLEFYFQRFDTVEINNSFYRLPSEAAFDAWQAATPADFCFAVKASRYITHMKKLKDPEPALEKFLPRAERLGPKLGPVLFQLPPWWEVNPERLESFLSVLPRTHLYAFEFRNPGWHCTQIRGILRRHNAAFCLYELSGFQSEFVLTADWTYIRLHGPGGAYQGCYHLSALQAWADRISHWLKDLRVVYAYFDNDQHAFATTNALQLKHLLAS
jgi:uncharacterized protein YecE (DUF72 family)